MTVVLGYYILKGGYYILEGQTTKQIWTAVLCDIVRTSLSKNVDTGLCLVSTFRLHDIQQMYT